MADTGEGRGTDRPEGARLTTLAAACLRAAGEAPARRPGDPGTLPGPGRFTLAEIARELIPVAPAHLRRVLKAQPDLPQGVADPDGTRRFTLAEVGALRAHLAAEGSRAKAYLPWRPEGLPARVVALANARAETGKTATAAHLAMAAALDGYRVLAIDLDGQGGLSARFGLAAETEAATILPLLARHHARHLQRENRARVARGEAPQPLDPGLEAALEAAPQAAVQATGWPGIDLIAAGAGLGAAELRLASWQRAARGWRPWEALGQGLAEDGLRDGYDIVLIDTPPALGLLTLGAAAAAQILLVPTRARAEDFAATGRFLADLQAACAAIEEEAARAARALGGSVWVGTGTGTGAGGAGFAWDALRVLIARYDPAREAAVAARMEAAMGPALLPQRLEHSGILAAGGTLYGAAPPGSPRGLRARERESFDRLHAAFRQLLDAAWRQAERARPA